MKTVFFDLGNVLLFFSHKKMCQQIADVFDTSFENIYNLLFKHSLARDYELGHLDSEQVYKQICQSLGKEGDFLSFLKAASDIFHPNTDIFPIVHSLKKQGHRLILLSNTCETHFTYAYSNYPILQLFDDKILSFEVKMQKPNPLIFQKALSLAHDNDSFYTDDLSENIFAARKQGLDGEIFTHPEALEQHLLFRKFLM